MYAEWMFGTFYLLRAPRNASQRGRCCGLASVLQLAVIAVLLQSAPGHNPGGGSRREGYSPALAHHQPLLLQGLWLGSTR